MSIYSLQIEKHVLGGLVKNPEVFPRVDFFLSDKDFFNDVHSVIYSVIRQALSDNEKLDRVVLAQKIKNNGISFKDDINIFDYIEGICFTQITSDGTFKACQELKKLTVRRELFDTCTRIQNSVKAAGDKPIDEVISDCDKLYGEQIRAYTTV